MSEREREREREREEGGGEGGKGGEREREKLGERESMIATMKHVQRRNISQSCNITLLCTLCH